MIFQQETQPLPQCQLPSAQQRPFKLAINEAHTSILL